MQIPTAQIPASNRHGFKIVNSDDPRVVRGEGGNAPLGYDAGDQFSDEQLRAIIAEETGKAPGPRTKRETLVATFNELNEAA